VIVPAVIWFATFFWIGGLLVAAPDHTVGGMRLTIPTILNVMASAFLAGGAL
jgi:hypothetical protein